MNMHAYYEELLPLYVAGQLHSAQRVEIEIHLTTCTECQADLVLWKAVSGELLAANTQLAAPPTMVAQILEQVHASKCLSLAFRYAWQLLRTQALIVQSELWAVSAAVMAMGVMVALISDKANLIYFLAPLVAASSLSILYGPEHDPALELSLSTPTSPWRILFARLSVVSAYNFLLSLAATLLLLFIVPPGMLGIIILGWLGPLAFLSALSLLLSVWLGTTSAIAITYGLWLLQYVSFKSVGLWMVSPVWDPIIATYQRLWHNPLLLLLLSLLILGFALWSANRPVVKLSHSTE